MFESKDLTLPEPIPYPQNPIIKKVYRTPILLYRLGLGKWIGKHILILTTLGRKTHQVRRTPVEYFRQDGRLYIISGFGKQPDWYRNLKANPHVTVQTDQGSLSALARGPRSEEEWKAVLTYLKQSPISRFLMPEFRDSLNCKGALNQIQSLPAVTFDPTDEPCPPAVEPDLVWAWPLILLALAVKLSAWWFITRKN
jgi:deazaflavin-dependent oxidoreductase (nitroreductase family)